MHSPSRSTSLLSNIFLVAALAGIWLAFAPTKIGGNASYVIINGNSMEPDFHRGDLVIIRSATTYNIGDIVTYWDDTLPAYVIHRIIDVKQERFVLQGDNNSWIDNTRPSTEDILGKLWVHIPRLGKFLEWMRAPLQFALIVALFGGILLTSKKNNSGGARKKPATASSTPQYLEVSVYIAAAIFLTFLGFFIYALSRPTLISASAPPYQQEAHFSYSADSIPGVYDGATIRSGEPVFPNHTCLLNIDFSYFISGTQLQGVSGSHQLYAHVLDEKSGWKRTIPLNQGGTFNGNAFASTGALDLCQVELLVASMEEQTGMRASNYKLEIIAPVLVSGFVSGTNITDSFIPTLTFRFDKVHFYLENSDKSDAAFTFKKSGASNGAISQQTNYMTLLGLKFSVESVRILSIIGLLSSICIFGVIAVYVYTLVKEDPEYLLRLKYSNLLVEVQGTTFEPTPPVIDVDSMETLAKLAENHNAMILHIAHPFLNDYLVQTTQSTYRYSVNRKGQPALVTPQAYSVPANAAYNAENPQQQPNPQYQQQPKNNNPSENGYW